MRVFVATLLEPYRPRPRSGQGLVEYAVIVVLVAVVAVLSLTLVGDTIGPAFSDIAGVVSPGNGHIAGSAGPGNSDIAGSAPPSPNGAAAGVQPADQSRGRPRHGQGWFHHFGAAGPPAKP